MPEPAGRFDPTGRGAPGALAGAQTGGRGGSEADAVIRRLASGKVRLYSRKKDRKTGKRRNLGTFSSRAAALRHERAIQFFKRRR